MTTVWKCFFAQIGDQSGKVGERFGIDGEGAVLVLVVDVEIERRRRECRRRGDGRRSSRTCDSGV